MDPHGYTESPSIVTFKKDAGSVKSPDGNEPIQTHAQIATLPIPEHTDGKRQYCGGELLTVWSVIAKLKHIW